MKTLEPLTLKPQLLQHQGKTWVAFSKKAYKELLEYIEDLEDLHSVYEAKAAREAGEETYPHELVMALTRAKTTGALITLWIEYRNLTADKLAKKAKISKAYMSEIINNKKRGSITVLKAISKALKVDLDDIVK